MLLDKLTWVEHEGPIYSVHAQPDGPRFATGGADSKVKVWSLAAAVDANLEAQPTTPKLLATLVEPTGPVNIVRFSHSGKWLAAGSDDAVVIVYELRPGPGGATLGGGPANLENWRPRGGGGGVLRGHAINVSDLAWSADDSKLATASLDRSVMVWDTATGHRLATLNAHDSLVKGVTWDPVGSYLASQSDDRSVRVFRTSDWSHLATIDRPYRKSISTTFATRLAFSPDGQFLLTGNSYQKGNHVAVVVPRGKWEDSGELFFLAGHTGAVVSTAFNPRMFHLPEREAEKGGAAAANGQELARFSEALTSVFATGDQDKRVVVWAAGLGKPLFAIKALFRRQVTDLSWTSDGYTLLACSADGTVGVFQFTREELGQAGSAEEMQEVMRSVYGDRQRAGGGLLFAESIDQLEEEPQLRRPPQQQEQQQPNAAVAAAAERGPAAKERPLEGVGPGPSSPSAPAPAAPAAVQPVGVVDALTVRLEGRLCGSRAAGETQVGFGRGPASQPVAGSGAAGPALVRGGDGRKRIVPESTGGEGAVGAAAMGGAMAPPAPRAAAAGTAGEAAPAAKRQRTDRQAAAQGTASGTGRGAAGAAAARAPPIPSSPAGQGAAAAAGAPGAQPAAVAGWGPVQLLGAPPVRPEWTVRFREDPLAPLGLVGAGEAAPQARELRIVNRERGVGGRPQAELTCLHGQEVQWVDLVAGAVVCACGTPNFAAVGLQDGSLLLYSPAGRRLGGAFKLGTGLSRLACDEGGWRLLAITTSGRVKLLHVGQQRTLLGISVAPLVEDGAQIADARLSRGGWPMLTLTNHRAYLWHPGLEEWMCVAEEAYTGSPYLPTMRLQNQGELTGLQADVAAASGPGLPRALLGSKPVQQLSSRALLESNLAAAVCLHSPQEYRRWLGTYSQLLTEMGDVGRLRELCMELMGPAIPGAHASRTWAKSAGGAVAAATEPQQSQQAQPDGDVRMVEAAAEAEAGGAGGPGGVAAGGSGGGGGRGGGGWNPQLLGLDKREELLVGEVLRVVGRSRALGGLAGEMRDLLEDIGRMG